MSILHAVTVFCDICDQWDDFGARDQTASTARRRARDHGWRRLKGPTGSWIDLCPKCERLP